MARGDKMPSLASLPKRARNALRYGGISTLEDVAEWSDRALLSLPHIGPASVAVLRAEYRKFRVAAGGESG